MRKMLVCRLEDAIIHQVENGYFDIECVAQYHQNTRERLRKKKPSGVNVIFAKVSNWRNVGKTSPVTH